MVALIALLATVSTVTWGADALDLGSAARSAPPAVPTRLAGPMPPGPDVPTRRPGASAAPSPDTAAGTSVRTADPVPGPDETGRGTFHTVAGGFSAPADHRPTSGPGAPRVIRYAVEVEDGIRVDEALALKEIGSTLTNSKGWEEVQRVNFVHVSARAPATADVTLVIASPGTTDRLCAPLRTEGEYSCQPRGSRRVVLNARRWAAGVPAFGGNLAAYRAMLVNHEVGHYLGHGHAGCPRAGAPAPVMQQQSISLQECRPNPWPAVA